MRKLKFLCFYIQYIVVNLLPVFTSKKTCQYLFMVEKLSSLDLTICKHIKLQGKKTLRSYTSHTCDRSTFLDLSNTVQFASFLPEHMTPRATKTQTLLTHKILYKINNTITQC